MDFKTFSVILVISLLVIGAAFVFVTYGDSFSFGNANSEQSSSEQVDNVFGTPPDDLAPPSPT